MFDQFKKGLLLIIVSTILMSCAQTKITYRYGNVNYDSPEPALAAQKADLDSMVNKITTTNHPIGGSAIVILPSTSYVVKNFIVWQGTETSQEMEETAINLRYGLNTLINGWRARADGVEKRRIFNSVVITYSDEPENATFTEDFALFFKKIYNKAQWFLKKKQGNLSAMIAIEEISTALPPVQREILWLDNVEAAIGLAKQDRQDTGNNDMTRGTIIKSNLITKSIGPFVGYGFVLDDVLGGFHTKFVEGVVLEMEEFPNQKFYVSLQNAINWKLAIKTEEDYVLLAQPLGKGWRIRFSSHRHQTQGVEEIVAFERIKEN